MPKKIKLYQILDLFSINEVSGKIRTSTSSKLDVYIDRKRLEFVIKINDMEFTLSRLYYK